MQSVRKTFEVLELVAQTTEGISLDTLSKILSYPKATAHRICKTLCSCGYIRQAPGGCYFITAKLITLGYGVIQSDSFVSDATPFLHELANLTGFTVNLQRKDIDKVILLKKEEPKNSAFHTNANAGLASALHQAACGKMVLAHLSKNEIEQYWERYSENMDNFKHFGNVDIHTFDNFLAEINRIKQQGWAIDGEGNESGITCLAVPLKKDNDVQYAISVSGLTPEIHRYGLENIVTEALKVAQKLSEEYL